MKCPYCGSIKYLEVRENPYPYYRYTRFSVPAQYIQKRICECGKPHFYEERIGAEIGGLEKVRYAQIYKQGWYDYKNLSCPF